MTDGSTLDASYFQVMEQDASVTISSCEAHCDSALSCFGYYIESTTPPTCGIYIDDVVTDTHAIDQSDRNSYMRSTLYSCTTNDDCKRGSFCNSDALGTQNFCTLCPPITSQCTSDSPSWINEPTNCNDACVGEDACTGTTTATSCYSNGHADDTESYFCNVNGDDLIGICTDCEAVANSDTISNQCLAYPAFSSLRAKGGCNIRCESDDIGATVAFKDFTLPRQTGVRKSDLETGGACEQCCTVSTGFVSVSTICEADESLKSSIPAPYSYANNEIDSDCSERYCGTTGSEDGYCMVRMINEGGACTRDSLSKFSETVKVAGICQEGACVVTQTAEQGRTQQGRTPHECPDGSYPTEEVTLMDNCAETQLRYAASDGVLQGSKCIPTGSGSCNFLPRQARYVYCSSQSQIGTFNTVANGNTVSVSPNSFAITTFYDPFWEDDAKTTIGQYEPQSSGRCLISSDNSDSTCIITTNGAFIFRNMVITWLTLSDADTVGTVLYIPITTKALLPELAAPAGSGNTFFGDITCQYYLSDTGGFPCGDEFVTCDPPFDPTLDPTVDPTTSTTTPATTTPATSHGDPIIWTFNDECYDLNLDGKYVATKSNKYDHHINIGIYNDFMRQIEVVSNKGETLLWISVNGEYEAEGYPYAFEAEEKVCPEDMEDTECAGTYMAFRFDAQDFQYFVHILRHDYADPALKEGELGYHLDIYPTPYQSFSKASHRDSYTGLYFENPLPNELEYCPGGSSRRRS